MARRWQRQNPFDAYIAIKVEKILAIGTGQPDQELVDDHTEIRSYEGKVATLA